jgi:hypothetical protein
MRVSSKHWSPTWMALTGENKFSTKNFGTSRFHQKIFVSLAARVSRNARNSSRAEISCALPEQEHFIDNYRRFERVALINEKFLSLNLPQILKVIALIQNSKTKSLRFRRKRNLKYNPPRRHFMILGFRLCILLRFEIPKSSFQSIYECLSQHCCEHQQYSN